MISKIAAISTALLASVGWLTLAGGCLDVVMVHVDDPVIDAGPGTIVDASGDVTRACEVCVRAASDPGPGCADSLSVCTADQGCRDTMECSIAAGCLELPDRGKIIDCGTPCGREAGLDLSSPSITYILAVVTCAETTCGAICRGEVAPLRYAK